MKSKVDYIKKDLILRLVEVGVLDKSLLENLSDGKLSADLEDIYNFKILGFTDDEVMSIFIFKKLAHLDDNDWQIYKNLFYKNKSDRISYRINSLKKTNDKLIKNIKTLKSLEVKNKLGVSINSLKYLKCVECDGELILNNGSINNNHILNGSLVCNSCKEEYKIHEGIIFVGDKKNIDVEGYEDMITKSIVNSSTEELVNINNAVNWVRKKLPNNLDKATILEVGSGIGVLLRDVYDKLKDSSTYIIVNDDIQRHYFIKQIIEKLEGTKNILFVCCDYSNLPIVNSCVDITLDICDHVEYKGSKTSNILLFNDYINRNSIFIASYLLLNKSTKSNEEDKAHFMLDSLKDEIKNQGYSIVSERLIGIKNKTIMRNLDKNTKLYNYMFLGKRIDSDIN